MTKNISREYLQKELNKINNFFISRNFKIVIEKATSLLKKDPTQVTFYNYIGLSHRQLGQLIKAEQIFKKGLLLFPRATSLLCNLGAVYRQMELFSDAEMNVLIEALKINPKNTNILINFANLKRDLNKFEENYKDIIAERLDDSIEVLLINLAGTYQIVGNFQKSKEVLHKLHLKFPNNVIADKIFSNINFYNADDDHQKLMLKKIGNPVLTPENKIPLYFAIAKCYSTT